MISLESSTGDEFVHLNEYKFDKSKLLVIKRTPKRRKISVGGWDKVMVEGYDEHTLWDVSSLNVSRIRVDTYEFISGMDLAGQTTFESMAWEISYLTQLVTQL